MPEQPAVSVVMGVLNGAQWLAPTIDSVLEQSFADFEFLIVNDGSTDPAVAALLAHYAGQDPRIGVIAKTNEGLTRALIDGCRAARGRYIARIDAGDVMAPTRLAQQQRVLAEHAGCHLVTSAVSFHGPAWEPLWVNTGGPAVERPVRVLSDNARDGLLVDIPHHGSVMFRKSAYEAAGGYRPAFYYGQDWDLWYRLAELGDFFVIPLVLYKARFFPEAISMQHDQRQRALAALSLEAHRLRKRGLPDAMVLQQAAAIKPQAGAKKANPARGYYFVGEALRRRGNPRCRTYLMRAIKASPLSLRSWWRLAQTARLAAPDTRTGATGAG